MIKTGDPNPSRNGAQLTPTRPLAGVGRGAVALPARGVGRSATGPRPSHRGRAVNACPRRAPPAANPKTHQPPLIFEIFDPHCRRDSALAHPKPFGVGKDPIGGGKIMQTPPSCPPLKRSCGGRRPSRPASPGDPTGHSAHRGSGAPRGAATKRPRVDRRVFAR